MKDLSPIIKEIKDLFEKHFQETPSLSLTCTFPSENHEGIYHVSNLGKEAEILLLYQIIKEKLQDEENKNRLGHIDQCLN